MARLRLVVGLTVGLLAGCGGDDFEDTSPGQNGGSAGESGASGSAGESGASGSAGTGGSSAVGGAAGTGGQNPGCPDGKADCDGNAANGCEITLGTSDDCGACGDKCTGDTTCKDSVCQIQCSTGKGDCDSNAANGCEADLTTEQANCGGCKKACAAAEHAAVSCESSKCVFACNDGYADCDKDASNGCEADKKNDPLTCGGCVPCPTPAHSKATCKEGTCGYECDAGWEDCDADASNGCEAELATSTSHCGACGHLCADSNGTPSCVAGKCEFACNGGYADCDAVDANGCETSLSDPKNCGQCGHDCKTSACSSGLMCEPIYLGQSSEVGSRLTGHQANLYWLSESTTTNVHSIHRLPKTGGAPPVFSSFGLSPATALEVDDAGAFAVMQADARVMKTPLTGGSNSELSKPTGGANGSQLALSSQYVFWFSIESGTAKLYRAAKTGSAPTLLSTSMADKNPSGLAADEQSVYWSDATTGNIQSISHVGTANKTLATGQVGARELKVDADHVYWVTGSNSAVASVSKSGGSVTTLATHAGEYLASTVVDDGYVWYASSSEKIRRVRKAGGTPFVMAQGQSGLGSMAVDAEYVYWLRYDNDVTSAYKVAAGK